MADDKEPKIQEIDSDADSDDEDAPTLDQNSSTQDGGAGTAEGRNRAEKKNRKTLAKLGFKLVPGVQRVTVRKSKAALFVIQNAEVYKCPTAEQFVIFGEAKVENDFGGMPGGAAAIQQAAEAMSKGQMPTIGEGAGEAEEQPKSESVNAGDDGVELDQKDIELVSAQAGCDGPTAIKALKKCKGDVVEAIMALTSG